MKNQYKISQTKANVSAAITHIKEINLADVQGNQTLQD